jgi:hypothetical protein
MGDKPAYGPRVVGTMNGVKGQGQLEAVGAKRVVRMPSRYRALCPAVLLNALFLNGFRDDPGGVFCLATHFKLGLGSRPILSAQTHRKGNDGPLRKVVLRSREVVEAHLRDINHYPLIS